MQREGYRIPKKKAREKKFKFLITSQKDKRGEQRQLNLDSFFSALICFFASTVELLDENLILINTSAHYVSMVDSEYGFISSFMFVINQSVN